MNGGAGSSRFGALLAALPDVATAVAYAWAWIAPLRFGADTVQTLMVVMLLEFLVVHSGAFIGTTVLAENVSRKHKTMAIAGFGAFYMLFALAFSLGAHSWWPAACFGWLLVSRFAQVWLSPLPRADEAQRMMALWGASVLCYLLAVFAGILLPLPRLGLQPEMVATLGIEGEGLWIEKPHTVMASGLLYFALVAWSKFSYSPAWGLKVKSPRRNR